MRVVLTLAALVAVSTVCLGYDPLLAPPSGGAIYFQPEPTPAEGVVPQELVPPHAEVAPAPVPMSAYPPPPSVVVEPGTILHPAPTIQLYQRVRVVQARNIHPQATPMIIAVPNPAPLRNPCADCVYVEVCVPPCDPTCIKCNHRGNRISYEFGRYAVNIYSRLGVVVVDYDD